MTDDVIVLNNVPQHRSTCRYCCPQHDALRAENEKWREVVGTFLAGNVALEAEVESLRRTMGKWQRDFETEAKENVQLRAALRQILEDPDAKILDSHRDDGWEALGKP